MVKFLTLPHGGVSKRRLPDKRDCHEPGVPIFVTYGTPIHQRRWALRVEHMKSRITINLTTTGEFEISVNEAGRDLLIRELQRLSRENDHFHLGPAGMAEVEVSNKPYRADDTIKEWGKVYFRPDDWDKEYFPHVL